MAERITDFPPRLPTISHASRLPPAGGSVRPPVHSANVARSAALILRPNNARKKANHAPQVSPRLNQGANSSRDLQAWIMFGRIVSFLILIAPETQPMAFWSWLLCVG